MSMPNAFKRYAASGALNRAATEAVRAAVAKQRALGLPLDGGVIKRDAVKKPLLPVKARAA